LFGRGDNVSLRVVRFEVVRTSVPWRMLFIAVGVIGTFVPHFRPYSWGGSCWTWDGGCVASECRDQIGQIMGRTLAEDDLTELTISVDRPSHHFGRPRVVARMHSEEWNVRVNGVPLAVTAETLASLCTSAGIPTPQRAAWRFYWGSLVGNFVCWGLAVLFFTWLVPKVWARHVAETRPPHACRQCHYNLTANTSGVCPECGAPIEAGSVAPQEPPQNQ
jgi:hypothetical protein